VERAVALEASVRLALNEASEIGRAADRLDDERITAADGPAGERNGNALSRAAG